MLKKKKKKKKKRKGNFLVTFFPGHNIYTLKEAELGSGEHNSKDPKIGRKRITEKIK